jgi:hypothetical protein
MKFLNKLTWLVCTLIGLIKCGGIALNNLEIRFMFIFRFSLRFNMLRFRLSFSLRFNMLRFRLSATNRTRCIIAKDAHMLSLHFNKSENILHIDKLTGAS